MKESTIQKIKHVYETKKDIVEFLILNGDDQQRAACLAIKEIATGKQEMKMSLTGSPSLFTTHEREPGCSTTGMIEHENKQHNPLSILRVTGT